MNIKEAHSRARDAVKQMLINQFFVEEFAHELADEFLSKIRAEFHAAGFVMVPKKAKKEMIYNAWAGVWTAMLAALPKLEDGD